MPGLPYVHRPVHDCMWHRPLGTTPVRLFESTRRSFSEDDARVVGMLPVSELSLSHNVVSVDCVVSWDGIVLVRLLPDSFRIAIFGNIP